MGDVQDEAQTVHFPTLSAGFGGGTDQGSELLAEKGARVEATVSYGNVEPEKTYRIAVTLVDASTRQPLVDGEGGELSVNRNITPSESSGEESIAIPFDATPHAGRRMGMRTSLFLQSQTLAAHETVPGDELTIPKITSESKRASADSRSTQGGDVTAIVETVSYEGLVPGTMYVLRSSVRDGESGAVLIGAGAKPIEGAEATCEVTPTDANGTVEIMHALDAGSLGGRTVVLCDVLTRKQDGRIVASWDGLAASERVRLASASSTTVGAHTGMACEPALAQAGVRSVDSYRNLEPGCEYAVDGILRRMSEDGSDGGSINDSDGNAVTAHATFTTDEPDGTVELAYTFDATGLAGSCVMVQETISLDGMAVVRVSGGKEVSIPSVEVTLSDAGSGLAETIASQETDLIAKVCYGNLPQTDGVTVVCDLTDARTGRVLLDANGNEASVRTTAEPASRDAVELALRADARNVSGGGIVANVRIEVGGTVVASTSDAWDERAMVSVPSVDATLADAASGLHVAPERSTLLATVTYEGLSPDLAHSVLVTLVDAKTREPITGRDGKTLAGVTTIGAGQSSGSVDVSIKIGAEGLAGRTVATAETLTCGEVVTAQGKTTTNTGRQVRIAKADVKARSDAFGDAELPCDERAKALVTVTYENLEPGLGYVVSYSLANIEDGKGAEGTTGEVTFEASKQDGTVEVPVTIDTRELAGKKITAHAVVSLDGHTLAEATTPDDQALHVPAIATNLHNKDGGKTVDASTNVTLVDTVSYSNLTPGTEYVLEGELVDAATGKPAVATVETGSEKGASTTATTSADAPTTTQGDAFQGKADSTTVWVSEDGTYHLDKSCDQASDALKRTTLSIAKAANKVACGKEAGTAREVRKVETSGASASAKSTESQKEERASTSTVRFTPTEASGTVEVEFSIHAKGLEGKRLVATQRLRHANHDVALHQDLTDEAQTVTVSTYGTISDSGSSEGMGQTGTSILSFVALGVALVLTIAGIVAIWGLGWRDDDGGDER
ncbi:MAG: VaFE repeat-containing surface-anchored protein [Atopobiaceae bacterium]|nr:VaFE repeat-containing surface-anchored protein [Atopobiaceae bacterium]